LAQSLKKAHEIKTVAPERDEIAQRIAEDALNGRIGDHSFVVLLRPFRFDGHRPMPNPDLEGRIGFLRGLASAVLLTGMPPTGPHVVDLETVIADILGSQYQFISVGGRREVVGAGRITTDNWQRLVRVLTCAARLVIFIPSDTPGCDWGAQEIIGGGLLNKTMFVMPRGIRDTVWNETREGWSKHGVLLPYHDVSGSMFFINKSGNVCWLCPLSFGEHFSPDFSSHVRGGVEAWLKEGFLPRRSKNDIHSRNVYYAERSASPPRASQRVGRMSFCGAKARLRPPHWAGEVFQAMIEVYQTARPVSRAASTRANKAA
jgi:hypothetical protein